MPCIILDRITKLLALKQLAPHGVKAFIPGLLSWTYVENRGMAFGMASGSGWILIALTALISAVLLVHLLRHPEEPGCFAARCG